MSTCAIPATPLEHQRGKQANEHEQCNQGEPEAEAGDKENGQRQQSYAQAADHRESRATCRRQRHRCNRTTSCTSVEQYRITAFQRTSRPTTSARLSRHDGEGRFSGIRHCNERRREGQHVVLIRSELPNNAPVQASDSGRSGLGCLDPVTTQDKAACPHPAPSTQIDLSPSSALHKPLLLR